METEVATLRRASPRQRDWVRGRERREKRKKRREKETERDKLAMWVIR